MISFTPFALAYREAYDCPARRQEADWDSEKLGPIWCVSLQHGHALVMGERHGRGGCDGWQDWES